jgi:hypothetical protein
MFPNQIPAFQIHKGLPRRELPNSHLVNNAERDLLLDLAGIKRNLGNLEAWILSDIYRIQFSGIEPPLHLMESKLDRFANSWFCRPARGENANRHPVTT